MYFLVIITYWILKYRSLPKTRITDIYYRYYFKQQKYFKTLFDVDYQNLNTKLDTDENFYFERLYYKIKNTEPCYLCSPLHQHQRLCTFFIRFLKLLWTQMVMKTPTIFLLTILNFMILIFVTKESKYSVFKLIDL